MQEVVRVEVLKLLDVGIIYPISDSKLVSLEVVLKKERITLVPNKNNELISTRIILDWRVCIDYPKLKNATKMIIFSYIV